MIGGLKPYAEYKESGLPWLDTVPKHWDMVPNRALMRDQRQVVGARASDYTLLSLTLRGVIARDMVNPKGKFPAQFNTYKVVKQDDFVFCLFDIDETPRGVGLSPLNGMITGAYDIFSPTHRINPRFLYHYYLFVDEGKLMKPLYTGLRKTIQRGVFASLKAPLPPPNEQAAIVRFLDHANRKIDGFIRAKRKLIGLLNEQKQAIIHRAVTRGLAPNVPLKPSGIPWLEDIPAHWEVWRISRFAKVGNGSTPSRSNMGFWSGGNYPWLNSSHVNRGFIDSADQFVTSSALRECHLPKVAAGSVLIAITGQGKTRGTSAVLGFEATINQHIAYITPRVPVVTAKYLHLSLVAAYATLRSISDDSGSTKGALTCEDLKRFKLAVPPIDEQERFVEAIATETKAANIAITRTEREIALMQEYRTRLTADIVTGKLDIRATAAKLPAPPTDAAELAPDEPLEGIESEETE